MRENRRTLVGRVVSAKMQKTVVVLVETRKAHPLYKRMITRSKRYKAHDEGSACRLGDLVRLVESRPISREKHWVVDAIVTRGQVAEVQPGEIGASVLSA
ncbi:MAG: 30S ribosomal protein S17 [Chloroflexi bacterium]|nr:30S ribosomal protein S17 [Chloroflexota bacterium]